MTTPRHSLRHNHKGFGAIELLLVFIAVAVLVGAGAYLYYREHKTTSGSSTSQTSNSNTMQHNTTPNPQPDPYAGWKVYTDTQHHYSFKYPASGWTINNNTSTQFQLLSADKSIEVDYIYADPHDNGPESFTPVSITDLTDTSQGLEVVGGLYDGITPRYNLVDASLLKTYPLTVGQASQFLANPHFSDTHVTGGTTTGTLRVMSAVSGSQTSAWFSGADAKTSLLILQSFTYQQ